MASPINAYNAMLTQFYNNLNYLQDDSINSCDHTFKIVRGYLDGGSREVFEKYFKKG